MHPGLAIRHADPGLLATALVEARHDTLQTFELFERHLSGLQVPLRDELNPPLWELGHIGWFQEFWIARNPQRHAGWRADPDAPRRRASPTPQADALYDSGRVAHERRWSLPLPDASATRRALAAQLDRTLDLLAASDTGDDALYFFRLALLHEDMHHEAALFMAQGLGVPVDDARWQVPQLPAPGTALEAPGGPWKLGVEGGQGFAFDNECGRLETVLAPFEIDAQVLRWQEFLPFAESGGYDEPAHWTPEGWRWRQRQHPGTGAAPRYLRRRDGGWQQHRYGRWQALEPGEPAAHLSFHEAQAWCRWAGRRLPTAAEWDCAAHTLGAAWRWGDVWEWTGSHFAPLPGFEPHAYRDYSAPWFDGRPELRGASFMTQPRMRHPSYRNFFTAGRNDLPAGFRTCAL